MNEIWNDRSAQAYLEKYGHHALNRLWLTHVDLSPDEFLLDIGCGGGTSIKAALSQEKGLREIHRVLRPEGRLLIIEEAFATQTEEGRLNSPQDLPQHLKNTGFAVSEHGHHDKGGESYWATLAQKT